MRTRSSAPASTEPARAEPLSAPARARAGATAGRWRRLRSPEAARAGFVLALAAGVALRLYSPTALWLDEAQTVAIARLPLHELLAALREDGSPPLYYLLLHGWIGWFGSGDVAVRSLSALFGLAALPLLYLLALRLFGRRAVANAALLLAATGPFAVRYSTEARMYSLVVLLTAAGGLALEAAARRPQRVAPMVTMGAISGLLALTHYWSLFLLAGVWGWLLVTARRAGAPPVRRAFARRGWLAVTAGTALALLPWLPTLLFQLTRTGAPWGAPVWLSSLPNVVDGWAGGGLPGALLALGYWGLLVLAVVARRDATGRLVLERARNTLPVRLAALAFGALLLGVLVSMATGSAYALRYSAIAFPPFVLTVAFGVTVLRGDARRYVVAGMVVLGLVGSFTEITSERTQAGEAADAVAGTARAGDVVVVCPDQLGPALARRLTGEGLRLVAYPTGGDPVRVSWVDYEARNEAADPAAFARRVTQATAPEQAMYLFYADGYRTFEEQCTELREALDVARPGGRRLVDEEDRVLEHGTLIRYPPEQPASRS